MNKDVTDMYPEVLKFIKIVENRTGLIGGYYQVQPPLRKDEVNLPNNPSQVEKRFSFLERNLLRNPQSRQDYKKFMN